MARDLPAHTQWPVMRKKPGMIDFDAMVAKGAISQETCDKIKAYMEERKPAEMPEMNGQVTEVPAMGRLLKDLIDAEVITQAEYDALVAAQSADAT